MGDWIKLDYLFITLVLKSLIKIIFKDIFSEFISLLLLWLINELLNKLDEFNSLAKISLFNTFFEILFFGYYRLKTYCYNYYLFI